MEDRGEATVQMTIGDALVHLAPWPPKLIDISCPEDLWSDEAAQVPMLASPSGWGSSMSSVLARELSQPREERRARDAEASPDSVQEHLNSVMSLSAQRRRLETQANVDAAVDRAAERTQSGQDDPDGLMDREKQERQAEEEHLLERAGEALRAAALRRASEDKLAVGQLASALPIQIGGGGFGHSTASGTTDTPSSSLSEVGDYVFEESISAQQVQEQIRRAAEAARERRSAEADGFSARIRQAAEDAWKRRTVYDEAPWTAPDLAHATQQNQQLAELQCLQQQQEQQLREQQQLQQQQLQRQVQQQLQQHQSQQQPIVQQQSYSTQQMQFQQQQFQQQRQQQQLQQQQQQQQYAAFQQQYPMQQQPHVTQQQTFQQQHQYQQQQYQQQQYPTQQQSFQQQQYPQQQNMPYQQVQSNFQMANQPFQQHQMLQTQPVLQTTAGYAAGLPSMAPTQGPLATMPNQAAPYTQAYMDGKVEPIVPPPMYNAPQFGGC